MEISHRRPPEWEYLAAGTDDIEVTSRCLDATGSQVPGEPYWLVSRVGGEPVLGLHLRLLDSAPDDPRYDIDAIVRGELPAFDERPPGSPSDRRLYPAVLAILPNWACIPVGPGAREVNLLVTALEEIDTWARSKGAGSVAFLFVPDGQEALRQALHRFGARQLELYPSCEMVLNFSTLEEYLKLLPSARRKDLRRLQRRLDEGGMHFAEADVASVREQVLEMRIAALRKHGHPIDIRTQAAVLDRIIELYPPADRILHIVRMGERLVAFSLSLRHGSTIRGLWWGQRPEAKGAYFVLLFPRLVETALSLGVSRINYGTFNWQLKVSFGCQLVQLSGHMWSPGALPGRLDAEHEASSSAGMA
ncbi:hypothetical protein BJY24_001631 [Nocardia transvalensis]|uniref:BioF2-like acetyltransferase domain-containing protein n=1 Tax=Nocardia transvalensis TaxID=37333 RepID=A0A7W9PBU5_9NOCA|nr:GNAT family N-acetyltransferase [Nocardia transvalensis]MBB5912764.1 hypothetical protein [Nocardia transvalensis]